MRDDKFTRPARKMRRARLEIERTVWRDFVPGRRAVKILGQQGDQCGALQSVGCPLEKVASRQLLFSNGIQLIVRHALAPQSI